MKGSRQFIGLCMGIGMTIGINLSPFAQTSKKATISLSPIPFSNIKSLSVGDKVPDIEFTMINYPLSTAHLSDFRGKLVLLDFWSTWCTSCIHSFSKMDSLQKALGEQMQIILVNAKSTGDGPTKIESFFNNWKTRYKNFNLPVAILDTLLTSYFPHKLLPHYVWINADGRVEAITGSEQVTKNNILKILDKQNLQLPVKTDINTEKPLFLINDLELNDQSQYSIFLKGKVDGLPSGWRLRKSGEIVRGRAITNSSLLFMYEIVGRGLINDFDDKRILLEVKDLSTLIFDKAKSKKTD